MRAVTAVLATAALVFPCSGGAVAQGTPDAAIRLAETRRFAAMMRADTTDLGQYLADQLVYTHSNALVETRTTHLEAIATKRTIYESIAAVAMSYQWYGEMAVGTGAVKSKGSLDGNAFDVTLRVTTVHPWRGGRWLLVAWQSTRMP